MKTDVRAAARKLRDANDYAAADRLLRDAIAEGMSEIADLYGMIGGNHMQANDPVAAAVAYDAGHRIEARFDFASTYNELNRLIARILCAPRCLIEPNVLRREIALEFVDVPQALAVLDARLDHQIARSRARDPWAAGDHMLTRALRGDEEGARDALQRLRACKPAPAVGVYQAYRDTVDRLAAVDTPARATLAAVRTALQEDIV